MFRAAHRSSSGDLTVFATSGLHMYVVIAVEFPLRLDYGHYKCVPTLILQYETSRYRQPQICIDIINSSDIYIYIYVCVCVCVCVGIAL
jgi:hypothetical protein